MRITRIIENEEGVSSFEEMSVQLDDHGMIGHLSAMHSAEGVIFRLTSPEYDYDWHRAPRRQFIVLLDGEIEIEVGSGETRRFHGGDVLLVEDITGKGHRTRSIGKTPRRSLFIPVGKAEA